MVLICPGHAATINEARFWPPRLVPRDKAYIITGPTSGIGLATAFAMAPHGTLILVGRDREKLRKLQSDLEAKGGRAIFVVCDLADLASVRRAAAEIVALDLPIVGLHNNAHISPMRPEKSAQG